MDRMGLTMSGGIYRFSCQESLRTATFQERGDSVKGIFVDYRTVGTAETDRLGQAVELSDKIPILVFH